MSRALPAGLLLGVACLLGIYAVRLARDSPAAPEAKPLTVFAAASLTEVLPQIDGKPRYSFAGSNQLALQIRRGAPADVFVAAAPSFTQDLFRRGLAERPRYLGRNSLVLVVPRSNSARLRSVFDLSRRERVRLVIGSSSVPVGTYSRELLRRLGLSSTLAKVVSEEPDAKSIVGKVALGEADAGFVYATDAKPVASRVTTIELPARGQPEIRYEIAVLRAGRNLGAARTYVSTLISSPRARRLFREAGFGVR